MWWISMDKFSNAAFHCRLQFFGFGQERILFTKWKFLFMFILLEAQWKDCRGLLKLSVWQYCKTSMVLYMPTVPTVHPVLLQTACITILDAQDASITFLLGLVPWDEVKNIFYFELRSTLEMRSFHSSWYWKSTL